MSSVREKLALVGVLGTLLWAQALPAQADGEFYVVARGENLFRIALKHGTTVSRLMELNGLRDASFVYAGQRLVVPPPEPPRKSGDAPRTAAPVAIGDPPNQSGPVQPTVHVVQPGQNLYRIALLHDVPYPHIMETNGLTSPDFVWVGQQLIIPAVAASTGERREPAVPATAAAPVPAPQPSDAVIERPAAPAPPAEVRPPSDALIHIVEAGQNLYRIALKYGISWPVLQQANSLPSPDRVVAGQRLVIPAASGGSASVSTAPLAPPAPAAARPAGTFRITFYCLVGPMSSGRWVYGGAAAADQSIFRLGTVVSVQDLGVYTIEDRFAWDAREQRLDIWVPSCVEAIRLGVMHKLVSVRSP
ncbi:MAG: LysM peptidoglycan-binding domain-containing protein [Chloroflexi bacterium]|nr:LysM peptidoglycan-binding domain-containing protein [Chloroflexota bacterium]